MIDLVLSAVREPVDFVDRAPHARTLAALAGAATLGIGVYGGAIHLGEGAAGALGGAARAVTTAGLAWTLSFPALIVLGALAGSAVPWRKAALASLVTVSFGGLSFLASIPVVLLLELADPTPWTRPLINTLVVVGVGGCSTLVFLRAMARLEGRRLPHPLFMGLFGLLFVELAFLIDLFRFTA